MKNLKNYSRSWNLHQKIIKVLDYKQWTVVSIREDVGVILLVDICSRINKFFLNSSNFMINSDILIDSLILTKLINLKFIDKMYSCINHIRSLPVKFECGFKWL